MTNILPAKTSRGIPNKFRTKGSKDATDGDILMIKC